MAEGNSRAVLSGLFAGLCWGIFWLPLRMLEQAGLDAPWAMVVFMVLPALMSLPVMWVLRADYGQGLRPLLGGVLAGVAFALYAAGLLYTEVVRAVLLFYMTPIWGFLLGWIFLGDRMTWYRWLSIGVGLLGLVVIFADDTGLPLPRNAGDWCGLVSGMFWAVGCTLILTERRVHILTHAVNFLVVGAIVAVLVAGLATAQGIAAVPERGAVLSPMVWFLPVALILILPGSFATIYAPSRLNPGLVGLLFMTEIVVATVTAALWAGERFGIQELVGLPLILSAGLIEPAVMAWRARRVI
ncbi:EamA-like transporter family protein [Roseovarius sp. THAF9]|uniref:DMT family transporter n=1 Tax=Roseovarius sp. THAF9 TaxID=2587847 RepID=UPI001268D12C|nr:DMT family transporter [Roseovarius sp. THAF9]QFT92223.1 EamA-like transporter family protein [Roseovarius sp. THAF9]